MEIIFIFLLIHISLAEKRCALSVYINEKGECAKCPSVPSEA